MSNNMVYQNGTWVPRESVTSLYGDLIVEWGRERFAAPRSRIISS